MRQSSFGFAGSQRLGSSPLFGIRVLGFWLVPLCVASCCKAKGRGLKFALSLPGATVLLFLGVPISLSLELCFLLQAYRPFVMVVFN